VFGAKQSYHSRFHAKDSLAAIALFEFWVIVPPTTSMLARRMSLRLFV
jgi:hypothetical protein